jgi:hypothetical protein
VQIQGKVRKWGNTSCKEPTKDGAQCKGTIVHYITEMGTDVRFCSRCGVVYEGWAQAEWIERMIVERTNKLRKEAGFD